MRRQIYPKLLVPNTHGAVTVTVAEAGGNVNVRSCVIVGAGCGLSSSAWPRATPIAKRSTSRAPQITRRRVELFRRRRATVLTAGSRPRRGGGGGRGGRGAW